MYTYVACQLAGWTVYCFVILSFILAYNPDARSHLGPYAGDVACAAVAGILTTHAYRFYIAKRGWLLLPAGKALLRVLASSLVLGCLMTGEVSLLSLLFLGAGRFKQWNGLGPTIFGWVLIILIWNLLYFGIHYFEASRRAQMEKLEAQVVAREAQLQRLAAQLNPHFMFNCLNSIRALITEDPVRARDMVTALSELLRYSLQSGRAATVPLSAELEIINTYLKLQAVRFENRLAARIEAAPETLAIKVPPMLVQSLVENSVKHGIEKLPEGGEIHVSSELKNGSLHVRVINSGQLGDCGSSSGIGLANARERLRLLYGQDATLTLASQGTDSVQADLSLPVEQREP